MQFCLHHELLLAIVFVVRQFFAYFATCDKIEKNVDRMFRNRAHAGEELAKKLIKYKESDALVAGLPRGGMMVADAIARRLHVPLVALAVKKIKAPFEEELALGAVGPDDVVVYNNNILGSIGIGENELQQAILKAQQAQKEAQKKFAKGTVDWLGKTVILVDDGIATGATVEAAIAYFRKQKVYSIILAVPVAAVDTIEKLKDKVDSLVVLQTPANFRAVGEFYDQFEQINDEEVIQLLNSNEF